MDDTGDDSLMIIAVLYVEGKILTANLKVHFSSLRLDWRTPQGLFDELDKEFNFRGDPCASDKGTLKNGMEELYGEEGLVRGWKGPAFLNPPYGREIGKWLKLAYKWSQMGVTVVCLIPSRTDTKWWHDYVMKADEIRFIKGRLHFDDHKNSAPFPSAVVVFRGKEDGIIPTPIPCGGSS